MKYAYWGFGMIMAGLIGIVFLVMFQSITINNETEYYVLKEAMEASMLEAVDLACYRYKNKDNTCGEVVKISEQKFVENFTRRFVENMAGDVTKYTLEFYDIIETPPKASVIVTGTTQNYTIVTDSNEGFDLRNALSGILEYDGKKTIKDENEATGDNSLAIYKPSLTGGVGTTVVGIDSTIIDIEEPMKPTGGYNPEEMQQIILANCCDNSDIQQCCLTTLKDKYSVEANQAGDACTNYANTELCPKEEPPVQEEPEQKPENKTENPTNEIIEKPDQTQETDEPIQE